MRLSPLSLVLGVVVAIALMFATATVTYRFSYKAGYNEAVSKLQQIDRVVYVDCVDGECRVLSPEEAAKVFGK